jgi:hypothetical protein
VRRSTTALYVKNVTGARSRRHREAHLLPEPQDVPLQRPVAALRFVPEAAHFADLEPRVAQFADNGPATLGPEIQGEKLRAHD